MSRAATPSRRAPAPDELIAEAYEVLVSERPRSYRDAVEILAREGMLCRPISRAGELSSSSAAAVVLKHLRVLAVDSAADASDRQLAVLTGLGRSTVNRALKRLMAGGQIAAIRPGTGAGFATRWRLLESDA